MNSDLALVQANHRNATLVNLLAAEQRRTRDLTADLRVTKAERDDWHRCAAQLTDRLVDMQKASESHDRRWPVRPESWYLEGGVA